MNHGSVKVPALAISAMLALAACTPVGVAVGAGATVAVAAAEERGVSGAATDTALRLDISNLWFQEDLELFKSLGLQIYEGRVLVSGIVADEAVRDRAIELAWIPDGVRVVINEAVIGDPKKLDQSARDGWVTTQVKSRLLFERDIDAINYSARTVDNTVYLLGVAQDRSELDRVLRVVRTTQGVGKVVSHVLTKDDPRRSL